MRRTDALRSCVSVLVCAVSLGFAVAGCRSMWPGRTTESPVRFWIADPFQRVFLSDKDEEGDPTLSDPPTGRIHLAGAGGEVIAFQIVLPPQKRQLLQIALRPFIAAALSETAAGAATGRIDLSNVRFYRLANVTVRGFDAVHVRLTGRPAPPAAFPDALIPLSSDRAGQTQVLPSETQTTVVWVELPLPKGVGRGGYVSELAVRCGRAVQSRPVLLETWPFDLPAAPVSIFAMIDVPTVWQIHNLGVLRDERVLSVSGDTAGLTELCDVLGGYAGLISSHGLCPLARGCFPRISAGPMGEHVDWTGYRKIVETFARSGGKVQSHWLVPVSLDYPPQRQLGPYESADYQTFLQRYLLQFNDLFVEPRLIGTPLAMLFWPEHGLDGDDHSRRWRTLAQLIHQLDANITVVDPYVRTDLRPFGLSTFNSGGSTDWITVSSPQAAWWSPVATTTSKRQVRTVWWRPGPAPAVPDLSVVLPYHFSAAVPWISWRYGADGVVVTDVIGHQAPSPESADHVGIGSSRDWLVYPGEWFSHSGPVPTVRLKMLQRGLQDTAYLEALVQAGKKDLADWLARHLVRFAHIDALDGSLWTVRTDGLCYAYRPWALARLVAGTALRGSTPFARPETDMPWFDGQVVTEQFRQSSEALVMECQGVQATHAPSAQDVGDTIKWTYTLALRNYTDRPVTGTLAFDDLPPALQAVTDHVDVGRIDWAWPARIKLSAVSASASVDLFGSSVQNVVFKGNEGERIVLPARRSALVVPKLEHAVHIDGSFDDWSDPIGPTAGDFWRAIPDGPAGRRFASGEARRAVWPTTVQVAHDSANLYFAFRCYQPKQALRIRSSNNVHLSDSFTWGEDLVEVLIDPDNRRSFRPEDIYHVVIKANGAVVCTRGLARDTPGGSSPWGAAARAAVKVFDDRWQAELVVPIADLDATDKVGQWWGLDLVRVSSAISELSTWSGAGTHLYMPASLGNMLLAR